MWLYRWARLFLEPHIVFERELKYRPDTSSFDRVKYTTKRWWWLPERYREFQHAVLFHHRNVSFDEGGFRTSGPTAAFVERLILQHGLARDEFVIYHEPKDFKILVVYCTNLDWLVQSRLVGEFIIDATFLGVDSNPPFYRRLPES